MKVDFSAVGLKVGLECHQQLATKEKLFCACKPDLFKGEPEITFLRRLRPTQSELGQTDPAAYFEFLKGVKILYEADSKTSCLVEMDEEPPHELNREALETALLVSLMMNATPVDEVHVMRKVVIDGSNTTGFQRTCVVGMNGLIVIDGKTIPIQHISLEEDAARKTGADGLTVRYRIDRLCVPLIEVTTGPVIYSPEEARKVAYAIGRILRATRKVKRGIGTIRQDLNVSIKDGALVEIKGVQELDLISQIVELEIQRQLSLLSIKDELKKRGLAEDEIRDNFIDVTSDMAKTGCRVIQKAISQGKQVFAVKLPKFSGLLGKELIPNLRLGTEMADRARFWGRVGGILHSDEIASYGLTEDEIRQLKQILKVEQQDAFILVADTKENAFDALSAVTERAKEALKGVPEETRGANPDGTTRYMRPRPGAARMYPETDVPPITVSKDYVSQLRSHLPEPLEKTVERLIKKYGLNEKLARQLQDSEYITIFDELVDRTKVSPTFIAATLTETFKALRRDGIEVDKVTDEQLIEVFELLGLEKTSKEAIPEIIRWLSKNEDGTPSEAIKALGLSIISEQELSDAVDEIIKQNENEVRTRGEGALSFLMGVVMKKYRGKVKPDKVNAILREKLSKLK
ncbi:MAG: Glu-tRNA(Gln) amidotransferase subunit GatE [Candidatus Bathyarchaeia archaeon]|nr:Glu-tRNA(Gln) amidotransferase subunit GatE [Candidatus Bathyarchaeota archaeon]